MLRNLYFFLRYYPYFRNKNGQKNFAENFLYELIGKTIKEYTSYEKRNRILNVEKEKLISNRNKINKNSILDNDTFYSVQKNIRTLSTIVIAIIIAEMFLNYVSTLIFIPGEGSIFSFLRWFISIVLTGGSVIVSEKDIEAILPIENYKRNIEGSVFKSLDKKSLPIVILWSILLIGIEIAIIGVSEARARDIEGGTTSGALYYGFIILSMVLPIIAGASRWDSMKDLNEYESTLQIRKIEIRITQIEMILQENEEQKFLYYKLQSAACWKYVKEFKTYKENYNQRHEIEEDLNEHFSVDFDAFQKESDIRYESDYRIRKQNGC
jgi:hypothetical protein